MFWFLSVCLGQSSVVALTSYKCSIQNKSSSSFLSLGCVLSVVLNLGHFLASCSSKKVLMKKDRISGLRK